VVIVRRSLVNIFLVVESEGVVFSCSLNFNIQLKKLKPV
jgi:hypothetical protein